MKHCPQNTIRRGLLWLLFLSMSGAAAAQTLTNTSDTSSKTRKTVNAQTRPEPAKTPLPAQAGVKQLFTDQERALAGLGTGNQIALSLVFREVNRRFPITEKQRAELLALYREETPPLRALRDKRSKQEHAVEEAIYGESFDPQHVEQLVNESAETQKELMTRQAALEAKVLRIFAANHPRQARIFWLLYEHLVGPQRNNVPLPMLVSRQYNGQWRALADLFGDDMDMLIPSFNSPLGVLLVLRQLELTPEQKTEFKTLAQEIRTELQTEMEQRAKALREQPGAAAQAPAQPLAQSAAQQIDRFDNLMKAVEENADRQVRLMKRQAHIETRIRQILRPKQWEDYTTLLRGMLAGNAPRPALPPLQQPGLRRMQPLLKRPGQFNQ